MMKCTRVLLILLTFASILLLCSCGNEENWIGKNPERIMEYGGHRYQRVDQSVSWRNAQFKCEEVGGHLVTITSKEEQEKIQDLLLEDASYEIYWLGMRRNGDGDMAWITDESVSYTNWAEGEPNGSGNYAQMFMVDSTSGGHPGEWDDCYDPENLNTQRIGFVCEWDS